jgi:uncharacterized metal-binding protein
MTQNKKDKVKKMLWCDQCSRNDCFNGYTSGKPEYCRAAADTEMLEALPETFQNDEVAEYHIAAARLIKRQKDAGLFWPRIQEGIEYAKELGVKKVGIAICGSMLWQGKELAKLMKYAGLEPCMVNCMAGGVSNETTGIPGKWAVPSCNPVVQAKILNKAGTEFNFIYGLCVGHDTLFIQHSEAPVSVLLVKDRVTGNNPGAVLFSFYHRNKMLAEYGGKPEDNRI